MTKYQFRIRTRNGLSVDNLNILGRDQPDAERKLFQMYPGAEIVECVEGLGSSREENLDLSGILALISKQPD
ncbi:MAG: hypothetical protein KIT73_04020 [Burkholderiales bacterium]|nr:hypothetical protein [Burkholderiales bacterium]